MKKIIMILCINLLIGNIIAWFMGTAPIDFPIQPYSTQEQQALAQLKQELSEYPDDADLLAQLGGIYSAHNELELAAFYLEQALVFEPNNPLALAAHGANSAKQSGAMLDFSMGIYKVYTLWEACDGLNQAVTLAPDNFEVRIYRLATFAAIGKINRYFEQVYIDETWFKKIIEEEEVSIPLELKQQFYLSMTSAYLFSGGEQDIIQAKTYFKLFEEGKLVPALQDAQIISVKQRIAELT